ncbi:MAG: hypothetical protein VX278_14735, partial [Myxococcota bacterium]|nr:hypothetical protein [Myxococcota bacterium]
CIANRHSFRRESGRPRRISLKEEYHRKGVVGGWEEDLMPSVREETLRFYDTVCPLLEPLYERSVLSCVNTNSLGG